MEKSDKKQLRKRYLQKRDRLTPVTRARDSAIIRHRVFTLPAWRKARTVLIYVSFRSEVETLKLIQDAIDQHKRVVVPFIEPDKKMRLSELQAIGDLAPGGLYGIHEPAARFRKHVKPADIDLALIPGTVFDRQGGRIGMGGGYFDQLLPKMPDARRIGLAYSVQLRTRRLPLQPHDVSMNAIITEKELVSLP